MHSRTHAIASQGNQRPGGTTSWIHSPGCGADGSFYVCLANMMTPRPRVLANLQPALEVEQGGPPSIILSTLKRHVATKATVMSCGNLDLYHTAAYL
ncbi:protein of unknown function [Streptantibioticus cattleyicolor NRRL 8057 = DSM 46488]|nr:protein of unknown function [Streptantibioticus cattleyicolor NRRL 8057 = DSM 46488]